MNAFYWKWEDLTVDFMKNLVEKMRTSIRKYPIAATLLSGASAYYSAQYGPAVRGGIRLIAPMVGLQCGE